MAGELSPLQSSIPIVANAADREARFPVSTRLPNQRVFRLDTANQERWNGSIWLVDFAAGLPPGGGRTVPDVTTYLANNAVFNVLDYNPTPGTPINTGVNDASPAIQAAINAAQAYIGTISVYMPQSPVVLIPWGKYKLLSTLSITAPIRLMGHGATQSVLYPATVNIPAITISLPSMQSTYIVYEVDHLGISGLNPFNNYSTQDLADGIKVTGATDVTANIHDCRIVFMTGHGVNLANDGNSCRVTDNVIEQCCKDGIHVDGAFNTNFWIQRNIIRENRRGIAVQNTVGGGTGYLTTGRITDNLIESNNGGTTGTIGSADRPSVGVFLSKAQWIDCSGNYSENQWNDWFLNDNVSFCTFRENTFLFTNSLSLVQTYGGPPVNQAGFYVGTGVNAYNNVIGNVFGIQPTRQSGTTTTNWGTGTFGDSYDHVTDLVGVNRYLYNLTQTPGNGQVLITNPSNRHTILNAEVDATDGAGRAIQYLRAYKSQEDYSAMSIVRTANQITYQGLNTGTGLIETITFPSGTLTNQAFFQGQAGPAGALSNYLVIDANGIVNKRWSDGVGGKFLWTSGSAAPTTGAHVAGEIVWRNGGGIGANIGWVCVSAGTPGTWERFGVVQGCSGDVGNVTTLALSVVTNSTTQWFNTPLTGNCVVTISTTGAINGDKFRIFRSAASTGSFTITVNSSSAVTLKVLPSATAAYCDVEFISSDWRLTGYGTL